MSVARRVFYSSRNPGRERCDVIKSQLLARLAAAKPHLHSRDVEKVVDAILDEITNAFTQGSIALNSEGFAYFLSKRARLGWVAIH